MDKIVKDIKVAEQQCKEISKTYRKTLYQISVKPVNIEATNEQKTENSEADIEKDMWLQLKRVSIPVFSGDKTKYELWKAAFFACIDRQM